MSDEIESLFGGWGFDGEPEDWKRFFGLDDNPFSPSQNREGLSFSALQIEIRALAPNVPPLQKLLDYYSIDVDNFKNSIEEFLAFVSARGLQRLKQGVIVLVSGPRGAGKTTFVNLCRYAIVSKLKTGGQAFQADVELNDPKRGFPPFDDIVKSVREALEKQAGGMAPEARRETLALILCHQLTPQVVVQSGAACDAPFQFLSALAEDLRAYFTPMIFATTSDEEVLKSFAFRPLGDQTDTKEFTLGELSGEDVIAYVGKRIERFRSKDLPSPDGRPIFPFIEDVILECFQVLDRRNMLAVPKLPFRNVNRILASALQYKRMHLRRSTPLPCDYLASLPLGDLVTRCIDKPSLDMAIKAHL